MDVNEYYRLLDLSRRRVRETQTDIKRFLYDRIDWRDRLISIAGSRGVGKTTLILQHMKEAFLDDLDTAIYVSLDHIWFETHSLSELVDTHYKNGGTHVFIDEVHYLKDWQLIIKNLYDNYPSIHIAYAGSSLLQIEAGSGDLSRRQMSYFLPGLSFREYLYFEGAYSLRSLSLEQLLNDHVRIAESVTEHIRPLKYFERYLVSGYYPFYKEVYSGYDTRLMQVVNQVLENDYPSIEDIRYSTVKKIKKMLYILAQSCPQTPNMSELYKELDTDRNQGLKMLNALERADLLNLLSSESSSLKNTSRPDKIYCDNTNLMFALSETVNIGTKRETFFLNQFKAAGYTITYPKQGDFLVDEKCLFEVGGRKKTLDQIKDLPNSYLAIDDEEVGRGNRIPLWMFGLLY